VVGGALVGTLEDGGGEDGEGLAEVGCERGDWSATGRFLDGEPDPEVTR
jgi:hypothetical protein